MTSHTADLVEELEELDMVEALMRSTGHVPSLVELIGRPAWQADAACRGESAAVFFPAEGKSLIRARRVCNRCTVAHECLQYALDQPSLKGVWAGTSERRRRRLRTQDLGVAADTEGSEQLPHRGIVVR